jgi:HSP20 family protein
MSNENVRDDRQPDPATTRGAAGESATTAGSTSTGSTTAGGSTGSGSGSRVDREESIPTQREGAGRSAGAGTGVSSRRGQSGGMNVAASPFALMQRMSEDMNRLFGQFGLGRPGLAPLPAFGALLDDDLWGDTSGLARTGQALWSPQVELFERGDQLVVRADLPGVKREDLQVEVQDDALILSGERREEREESRGGVRRTERSYGRFHRTIPLPEGMDPEQCEASFKDGVLEVTLAVPKQDQRQPKRIPVR